MKTKKILTAVMCLCMTAQMSGYIPPIFNASADSSVVVEQPVKTEYYDIYQYKNLGRYIQITAVATNASGKIEVPEEIAGLPVKYIGEHAFAGNTNVTEIVLPSTVTTIDKQAFYQCTALETVNIPEDVTRIDDETFINCKSLKSIRIPENVTSIGTRAFYGCSSLTKVNIPDSVTRIKEQAFHDCLGLTEINIPDGVTSIEANTFNGCTSIDYITLPESVATIGMNAFPSTLKMVTINNPDCELHDFAVNFKNTTIKSVAGSKVEAFAVEHGINFVAITEKNMGEDINGDGIFTVADVVTLNNWLMGRGSIADGTGDINNDGYVDVFDLYFMKKALVEKIEAGLPVSTEIVNLTADIKSAEVQGKEADDTFINGQTDFALELFQNTVSESQNVLVSPYSVVQALAMTGNGADGVTKEEFENVIGGGIDFDDLNKYLYTQRTSQPNDDKCKLLTANSVWTRNNEARISPYPEFLQSVVDYYNAEIFTAPFDEKTIEEVNKWVDTNTDHMIPSVIDEIQDECVMMLINAVTFDAKWKKPYTEDDVIKYNFQNYNGDIQEADMMMSSESYYLKDDNAEGFYKYYKGNRYAFAVLLPDEDITVVDYVKGLTPESLHNVLANPQSDYISAGIPKFSYDYSTADGELVKILSDMGMPSAFDYYNADFSKLALQPKFISEVIHKTHIDVFEEGTKASAVTAVLLNDCTAMPAEKEIILDRPFVYCIVDTETYLPVFMGTLMNLE
ncbi:MAG: leucine-rich repeat protein [Ruminococcus flavefaciens]|nr:leucine-rich repeat protein [Ruminococcus flavefaciens]